MKKLFFSALVFFCFLSIPSYSQTLNPSDDDIDTLYYLPQSATFISSYMIADEIYFLHTRFIPKSGWNNYKLKEIQFLYTTTSIGTTIPKIDFYKDTLETLIYSQNVNAVLTSDDVYPNWYKIPVQGSPVISGIIEVPIHLGEICVTESEHISGNTIGLPEGSPSFTVKGDFPIKLIIEKVVTGISDNEGSLRSYSLEQNYPNPFNPTTNIRYSLSLQSNVKITISNILGEVIKEFIPGTQDVGDYNFSFDADGLSSGVYLYTLVTASTDGSHAHSITKKMLLMR